MRAGLFTMTMLWGVMAAACQEPAQPLIDTAVRYQSAPAPGDVRFNSVEIHLEAPDRRIAAYQFELAVTSGDARIVGIEGSNIEGFKQAPYYDPAALAKGRVIIAAFSTRSTLPKGKNQVATVHMREAGKTPVVYELRRIVAADETGVSVTAQGTLRGKRGGTR